MRARSGPKGLAAGTAAPTATQGHLCRAVCHNRTIACGTVLLASPSACATVTIAAAPSAATTTSPAWLGTGGPWLGIAGPAGIRWGHSLGIGCRSTRVVAGSWTGLRAQGTCRCCWGRGPIVARGGAQGRSGRWGARGVGGRHSWGLGVLVAVDRLGAIFGWRLADFTICRSASLLIIFRVFRSAVCWAGWDGRAGGC